MSHPQNKQGTALEGTQFFSEQHTTPSTNCMSEISLKEKRRVILCFLDTTTSEYNSLMNGKVDYWHIGEQNEKTKGTFLRAAIGQGSIVIY